MAHFKREKRSTLAIEWLRVGLTTVITLILLGCSHAPVATMAKLTRFKASLRVQQIWRVNAGGGSAGRYLILNPVYSNGRIYTASFHGAITAIDAKSGKRIWQKDTHSPLTSGIAASHNLLFIGTGFGVLYATHQNDGSLAWKTWMPSEVLAAPVLAGNTVLVKSENGELLALNVTNGKMRWTYKQPTPTLLLRGGSSPAVSNGLAIAGFADGKIVVLTLDHGQPIWHKQVAAPNGISVMQNMVDINATPIIRDGIAYAATYQGEIAAYQLQTGRKLWHKNISTFTGMVTDGQNVYVTDAASHLWAFNSKTGEVEWRQNQLYGRWLTAPALLGNIIIVADREGYAYFLSANDGRFLARKFVGKRGVLARPLVVNRSVYLYTEDGRLIKYQVG